MKHRADRQDVKCRAMDHHLVEDSNYTIYPVILSVPEERKTLTGRQKVAYLSKLARQAGRISAQRQGADIGEFAKNENGVPAPCCGYHWSISHKSEYVGGVVAPFPIGLDIEKIRPFSSGLFERTGTNAEWRLIDSNPQILFFRYWTSKEAVLKAEGKGIEELSKCRILKIRDENHLMVAYNGRQWLIEHFFFDHHVASVVCNGSSIRWAIFDGKVAIPELPINDPVKK